MSAISNDDLEEFCAQLKKFRKQLPSPAQQNLLDTILKIARQIAAPLEPVADDFGCFEPNQAALILAYHQGAAVIRPSIIPGIIQPFPGA